MRKKLLRRLGGGTGVVRILLKNKGDLIAKSFGIYYLGWGGMIKGSYSQFREELVHIQPLGTS